MKKKFKTLGAIFLIIILLLGGTYAFISNSQNKRNQADGDGGYADLSLIQKYNPPTKWKVEETLDNLVYVAYPATKDKNPQKLYARIKASEYLDYQKTYDIVSDDYYVTYSDEQMVNEAKTSGDNPNAALGEYVKFYDDNADDARLRYEASFYGVAEKNQTADYVGVLGKLDGDYDLADKEELNSGKAIYYVKAPTIAGENIDDVTQTAGQFGKKLVKEIKNDEFYTNILDLDKDVDTKLSKEERDEIIRTEKFTRYFHSEVNESSSENIKQSKKFRDYVSLGFAENIMTKEEYDALLLEDVDPTDIDAWIYVEDENKTPWFYWSHALLPGQETLPLLKNMTLIKELPGNFHYLYNVKLEATTLEEMKNEEFTGDNGTGIWTFIASEPIFASETFLDIPYEFGEDIWLNETGKDTGGKDGEVAYRAIAKNGDYKLVVRKNVLPIGNIPYGPGDNYTAYSNLTLGVSQTNVAAQIDTWFRNISKKSELRTRAIGIKDKKNLGLFSQSSGFNNDEANETLPTDLVGFGNIFYGFKTLGSGFSTPKPNGIPKAFPLSVQEASRFCSYNNGTKNSPYQAIANFDAIARDGDGGNVTSWLRSPDGQNSSRASVLDNTGLATSLTVTTPAGVRPALWIKGQDVLNIVEEIDYDDYVEYGEDLWLNEEGSEPGTPENGVPYRAIAKVGAYKLVVRKNQMGNYKYEGDTSLGGVRYTPSGNNNYIHYRDLPTTHWNIKSAIDCWFDPALILPDKGEHANTWRSEFWGSRLATNSEVRARAVGTDALTNLGLSNITGIENDVPNTQSPTWTGLGYTGNGFSTPKESGLKIAFALSMQETSKYLSKLKLFNNSWSASNKQAQANWYGLDNFKGSGSGRAAYSWLRSPHATDASHAGDLGSGGSANTSRVTSAFGFRPALWINL